MAQIALHLRRQDHARMTMSIGPDDVFGGYRPGRGATVLFGEVLGVSPTLGWGVGRVICILLVVSQLL
jgi:hypothetical protein